MGPLLKRIAASMYRPPPTTLHHAPTRTRTCECCPVGCNDTAPPLPSCDKGPYVLADMECMHAMMKKSLPPTHMKTPPTFLAAFVKGEAGHLAIMSADAQKAHSLNVIYDGPRPSGYEVREPYTRPGTRCFTLARWECLVLALLCCPASSSSSFWFLLLATNRASLS